MKSIALAILIIPLLSHSSLAQQAPPTNSPPTNVSPAANQVVDPSQQPLPDQSLTRPTQGVDNATLPLSDQTLLDAPGDVPVSGGVQISPRVSSGPDNTVRSKTQKTDDALAQKIRKNLLNHDANFAKTVVVTSKNGVVTLTGQVDSAAQKNAADKIARRNAGKATVKNELTTTR